MGKPPTPKPPKQPYQPDPLIVDQVLARLADGETLRAICRSECMPSAPSFLRWCEDFPHIAEPYARARREGLDAQADEMQRIADDQKLDPNSRRVMIDTRKWLLSKLRPDKYGDSIKVEHSGGISVAEVLRAREEKAGLGEEKG